MQGNHLEKRDCCAVQRPDLALRQPSLRAAETHSRPTPRKQSQASNLRNRHSLTAQPPKLGAAPAPCGLGSDPNFALPPVLDGIYAKLASSPRGICADSYQFHSKFIWLSVSHTTLQCVAVFHLFVECRSVKNDWNIKPPVPHSSRPSDHPIGCQTHPTLFANRLGRPVRRSQSRCG